ncbi:MAG: hypothetical protein AAGG72_04610, partial [Pseudomonadota bacterium]
MATIISVHGTFAHSGSPGGEGLTKGEASDVTPKEVPGSVGSRLDDGQADDLAPLDVWWAEDSRFADEARRDLTGSADGNLNVKPFVWSGDNSETARRRAGRRLFRELRELEDSGEKYCLVGHSHGGSVISHALMFSAARKQQLVGLQRWLTIGTPFVHLRKERFLFFRLSLVWKAIFIASLMLLFMLLFFVVAELLDGRNPTEEPRQLVRIAIAMAMTSMPFVVFYFFANYRDGRKLFNYDRKTILRAHDWYARAWVPLSHEDDEAVNGLGSLNSPTPSIFHATFAVPALTLLSAFILPLIYLITVFSPTTMVTIAEGLRDNFYSMEGFEQRKAAFESDRQELRGLRRAMRRAESQVAKSGSDTAAQSVAQEQVDVLRQMMRNERQQIRAKYEDLPQIRRVSRFQRRFFLENGRPCENNSLCGG